jgi:hypothetical protein
VPNRQIDSSRVASAPNALVLRLVAAEGGAANAGTTSRNAGAQRPSTGPVPEATARTTPAESSSSQAARTQPQPTTSAPRPQPSTRPASPPASRGPGISPQWSRNRLIKELHARGFVLDRQTTSARGLLYRNPATGEEIRIMPRPPRRYRGDSSEKHQSEYYYRYRTGPDQPFHLLVPGGKWRT